MTDFPQENIQRLDCDTIFFTLDDHLRVMPLKFYNFIEQAEVISTPGWLYQTRFPGNTLVSSTFLGINTMRWTQSAPMVFETMIFRDGVSDTCRRFSNIDDCIQFHHEIVEDLSEDGKASLTG